MKKLKPTKVLLHILLIAFAVIQIYPLLFLAFFSLKDNNEIYSGNVMGIPREFHWSNYQNALFNANVGHYLINSIFVTAIVILISDILACMVSYAIARMRVSANRFIKPFFSIGLMIPLHAVLLPVFIMLRNLKMLDTYQAIIVPYIAFALPMGADSEYLPHNYPHNCVVYAGTHDNETIEGWLASAAPGTRRYAKRYFTLTRREGWAWGVMRGGWASTADLAVMQMQDLLSIGAEGRINIPSTLGGNWQWRMLPGQADPALADRLRQSMALYHRLPRPKAKRAKP